MRATAWPGSTFLDKFKREKSIQGSNLVEAANWKAHAVVEVLQARMVGGAHIIDPWVAKHAALVAVILASQTRASVGYVIVEKGRGGGYIELRHLESEEKILEY